MEESQKLKGPQNSKKTEANFHVATTLRKEEKQTSCTHKNWKNRARTQIQLNEVLQVKIKSKRSVVATDDKSNTKKSRMTEVEDSLIVSRPVEAGYYHRTNGGDWCPTPL